MGSEQSEVIQAKQELQNLYIRAESLMLKTEGVKPLKKLLPEIDEHYNELLTKLNACEGLDENEIYGSTDWCKADLVREKLDFDIHCRSWLSSQEAVASREDQEEMSVSARSSHSRSSTASEKLKSKVKLKVASTALQQETKRVYETRLRAKQFAESKRLAALEEAEMRRRHAEAEAARIIKDAKEEAEAAERKALYELNAEIQEIEESTERDLQERKLDFELAKAEVSAWEEPKIEEPTFCPKKPLTVGTENGWSSKYQRPNVTFDSPTIDQHRSSSVKPSLSHKLESASRSPQADFNSYPSAPQQARPRSTFALNLENSPRPPLSSNDRRFYEFSSRRFRPLPPIVIHKFDGDPMTYWLFVRQFEAHVMGKVEDYELFPLLHQNCSSNVQQKIDHLSNQPPVSAFKMAWDLLYDEYGHSHEIARCCEEQLRSASKVNEDDRNGLKVLANLMEKCCISLENIGQSSSLDSMHVMMGVVNKLPVDLKRAWVEFSVKIEKDSRRRAKFVDLSDFLNERSSWANSIFGRETFPTKPKPRKESSHTTSAFANSVRPSAEAAKSAKFAKSSDHVKTLKCFFCDGQHRLTACDAFTQKSVEERCQFLRSKQICFKCLGGMHMAKDCKSREKCDVAGCAGTLHHRLIHKPPKIKPEKPSSESSACSSSVSCMTASVYLNVVPVRVCVQGNYKEIYAFLDQGSTTSFCDEQLAKDLAVKGSKRSLTLKTLTDPKVLDTVSFEMSVQSLDGGEWIEIPDVVVIKKIPINPNSIPSVDKLHSYDYLSNVTFPSIDCSTVQLLIGANVPKAFRVQSAKTAPKEGLPDAVRSPLGWSLLGPSLDDSDGETAEAMFLMAQEHVDEELDEISSDKMVSLEDRRVFKQMRDCVKMVDGHYELPLPWRKDDQELPNNKFMAEKRLKTLRKKLNQDSELKEKYIDQMNIMIQKGFMESVRTEDGGQRTWYIPHHAVMNPRKPEKVRIVFDCAAEYKGTSLNQVLMQGPDLVNSLAAVLMRFRKYPVAMVADIEGMFLQVKVKPSDRDSLRLLWWPNGDLNEDPMVYRMAVHLFGATSSPSCATYALRQAATDFGPEFEPFIASAVEKNFYIDDCLLSVPNIQMGIKMAEGLRALLSKAGFRLTKWISNKQEVINSIPPEEHSKSLEVGALKSDTSQRVLGIQWSIANDSFHYDVVLPWKPRTKRGVLATMNSVFDPLGFVTPVILEAKLVFRVICESDLEWDEPLQEELLVRWEKWIGTLKLLQKISIPRCLGILPSRDAQRQQLHFFVDASKVAYGAVCYLRTVDTLDKVNCMLVMSKSYLAPKDEQSIPRLELLAAVTAVKMNQMLSKELCLDLSPSIFWSDSSVVLLSLRNERKRFPLFVSRRISMIAKNTCVSNWNHVPTKLNPADILSRGARADDLAKSELWFEGPEFLKRHPGEWPRRFKQRDLSEEEVKEFDKRPVECFLIQESLPAVDKLISHFSSYFKLKRAVAWLSKVKDRFRAQVRGTTPPDIHLRVADLHKAELDLVRYEQVQAFGGLMKKIPDGKPNVTHLRKDAMAKLNPIMLNGLLRVGGRLEKAPVPFDARHPIILPHVSHLTDLVIAHYHVLAGHGGLNMTLNLLVQRFWILQGSAAIRRVIKNCYHCRKLHAKPEGQKMADLPESRLQIDSHPFAFTGLDYFGPMLIQQKRSQIKRYGCIFTCLTTRAVHLEVSVDLSTDSFINVLRRFLSRRGPVIHFYSDNGSNFAGAERVLRDSLKEWNQHQIEEFLLQRNTDWTFNPPSASHFGGAWERQIRSVRRILTSLAGEKVLSDDQLHTFLLEVEAILNERPLTPVTLDPDNANPLTPNHLLKLHPTSTLPPTLSHPKDSFAKRRWRHVQLLADQFWKRWSKEYLHTIISRQKWHKTKPNLQINDVVLLIDETAPRSQWRMGKIVETYPDESGIVRSVMVKTQTRNVRRPVHKLSLIVRHDDDSSQEKPTTTSAKD